MTQDEIIRMAREAGFDFDEPLYLAYASDLERFAALVAEATKEKAAKVCEECFAEYANNRGLMLVADKCAAAIRSMK